MRPAHLPVLAISVIALTVSVVSVGAEPPAASDERILRDVAVAVRDSPDLTIFDDVQMDVSGGIVTMTGHVTRAVKGQRLEGRVSGLAEVRAVRNQLVVLPASRDDDRLRESIARVIYGNASFWRYAMLARPPLHIIVQDGRVRLTGSVKNESDRALARALAMQSGAVTVVDDLKIDPTVP